MFRALVLAVVVALGIGGAVAYRQVTVPPASAQQPAAKAVPAVAVEVAPVRVDAVTVEVGAVGSLRANEAAVIAAEIEGRVSELPLEEGGRVEAGRVLARLDAAILESELAQAEANLVLTQANFERADKLFRQSSGTERARDEALAALQSARASVALARTRLDKTVIRAPFPGILGLRAVSVGEFVTRGEELVTLQSIDPIKVDFRVSETQLGSIGVGQSIAITVDALPGRTFTGTIYAVDPQVDVNGRAIRLRARIPNQDGKLLPGLFARVVVTAAQRDGARVIPESAVVPQGQQRTVFKVVDGKAVRVPVTLGQRRPGEVEVLDGLREGDIVVTAGHQRLRDGVAVEIVRPNPRS
jgi:membrane fusion protein (multidrug efflux system)